MNGLGVSMRTATTLIAATLVTAFASAQNHAVVPSNYASADAPRFCALPGALDPFRHQLLIGSGHLTTLVGRTITALEFRRSAANETFAGGVIDLSVELSATSMTPLECSADFASNPGTSIANVFNGLATIPSSPPVTGPTVPWSASNTVRLQLSSPFLYTGGTLCLDLTGTPVFGQEVEWWPADAAFESVTGTTNDLGGGCGTFGGASSEWSSVDRRSLVPGGYATFRAYGTPFGLAIAAFGSKSSAGVPLSLLGFNSSPGCDLHLATLDALMPSIFIPDPAVPDRGGRADATFKIPGDASVLGATMATQWLDWSQVATSNAIEWTVASSVPTLDMALVEGHPQEPTGNVATYMAHVIRFEYQ